MKRYIIPSAVAALLFASAGSWALAGDHRADMNSDTNSTRDSEAEVGAPPQADIALFQGANLSLTDAIHAAQQQHKGRTIESRFEEWRGQPAYFVRTYANNQVWEGRINANSGQLIGQPRTFAADQLTWDLSREAKAAKATQTSLIEAVTNAEQQQGGKAIMAKLQPGSNGKASYDVDVVKNGQFQTAMVDASTGNVG
jgi:uncharacterized membrane protein YkoI